MSTANVSYTVPVRTVGAAYLWWLFLGGIGAHKFYLGRPGWDVVYAFTLGLLWFGLLYDLFTLPSQVRAANAKMMESLPGQTVVSS
jgi:TM2 domain-containing membrane protein YozV